MIVRTADKSLAQALLKLGSVRSAKLLYGHNGMVGRRDGTVCPPPDVQHTVIIALGDILPMVCLTDEAVIVLYVAGTHIIGIVGHHLIDYRITGRGIGRGKKCNHLVFCINGCAVVRVFVQKAVARREGETR